MWRIYTPKYPNSIGERLDNRHLSPSRLRRVLGQRVLGMYLRKKFHGIERFYLSKWYWHEAREKEQKRVVATHQILLSFQKNMDDHSALLRTRKVMDGWMIWPRSTGLYLLNTEDADNFVLSIGGIDWEKTFHNESHRYPYFKLLGYELEYSIQAGTASDNHNF